MYYHNTWPNQETHGNIPHATELLAVVSCILSFQIILDPLLQENLLKITLFIIASLILRMLDVLAVLAYINLA